MEDDLKRHLAAIEQHNRPLDCFSRDYRLPVRLADGTLSFVTRNGGTALCGSPTFTLPEGTTPLLCWEELRIGYVVPGHDPRTGPTHPCPYCVQVHGTEGQEMWVFVDGKLAGSSYLRAPEDDGEEDDEGEV